MSDLLDALRLSICKTPEEKATALLLRHLNPEQQYQLTRFNYFDGGSSIGQVLRFHNVLHGFVELPGQGVWCLYTPEPLPPADETLAKKLTAEANFGLLQMRGNWMPLFSALVGYPMLFCSPEYVGRCLYRQTTYRGS